MHILSAAKEPDHYHRRFATRKFSESARSSFTAATLQAVKVQALLFNELSFSVPLQLIIDYLMHLKHLRLIGLQSDISSPSSPPTHFHLLLRKKGSISDQTYIKNMLHLNILCRYMATCCTH